MSVIDLALQSIRRSELREVTGEEPKLPPVPNVFQAPPAVAPATITLPEAIRQRVEDLDKAKAQYSRIAGLITEVTRSHEALNSDYEQAFAALATSEAAITLDGAGVDSALRKTVSKHREALLLHEARISGLKTRLRAAQGDLDAAMRALGESEREWQGTELAEARAAIKAALCRFIEEITSPYAVALAHGDRRLSLELSTAVFLDPQDHENAFFEIRFWKQNEKMCDVVKARSDVHNAVTDAITATRLLFLQPEELAEV